LPIKVVFWAHFGFSEKSISLPALPFSNPLASHMGASLDFGQIRELVSGRFHNATVPGFELHVTFNLEEQFTLLVIWCFRSLLP
jgi:hypothetical protein